MLMQAWANLAEQVATGVGDASIAPAPQQGPGPVPLLPDLGLTTPGAPSDLLNNAVQTHTQHATRLHISLA